MQSVTDMAFTALQYLPLPVLVLSGNKTVVLANEAMGRLLGIDTNQAVEDSTPLASPAYTITSQDTGSATDILYGMTLGTLGVELLQNGNIVWVSWEDFLDSVIQDAAKAAATVMESNASEVDGGDVTPTTAHQATQQPTRLTRANLSSTIVHDVSVDVLLAGHRSSMTGLPKPAKAEDRIPPGTKLDVPAHVQATMIISVWAIENIQYFTLTFTSATETTAVGPRIGSRTVARTQTGYGSSLGSGSSSSSSGRRTHGPHYSGSVSPYLQPTHFPPRGPPVKAAQNSEPSLFSKSNRLKDALINSMSLPMYAMWKDESFAIPNKAILKLIHADPDAASDPINQRDFVAQYDLWSSDFSKPLGLDEYPIMHLMKTQKSFENRRVGMRHPKTGQKFFYEVDGICIEDARTDEFLGGLVIFRDVTGFENAINAQRAENEAQFENITNMIPQMIWTAAPDGMHTYFSQRWYDYTGLTPEQSLGRSWTNPFHPDDLVLTGQRWAHSLATGEEYITEYRCLSKEGEWRWMLGRAAPMRDADGKIVKWFGSCTDIHELVQAREAAKQTREQLLQVIEHAKIVLWAVDRDRKLVLHEGAMFWGTKTDVDGRMIDVGMKVEEMFGEQFAAAEKAFWTKPLDDILSGESTDETVEVQIPGNERWLRTRFVPLHRQERNGGVEGEKIVDGVVGFSMDVTELRRREAELRERDRENGRLLAQSEAAKEASRMKSQFLANVSFHLHLRLTLET